MGLSHICSPNTLQYHTCITHHAEMLRETIAYLYLYLYLYFSPVAPRFDRELVFPLPNSQARASILDIHTRKWSQPPAAELKQHLAHRCVGYCGADLKASFGFRPPIQPCFARVIHFVVFAVGLVSCCPNHVFTTNQSSVQSYIG